VADEKSKTISEPASDGLAGKVLVTGGAGFIGSHVVEALRDQGADVRVVDNLDPQAHGAGADFPSYLEGVDIVRGDVKDPELWRRALADVSHVVHFAAAVGLAQSMYEITYYTETNVMGTAHLLQALSTRAFPVAKLLVASSMSLYGEGLYRCGNCGFEGTPRRDVADLEAARWEMYCPRCGAALTPIPTPETKPLQPSFVYSINKRDQEELCLSVGRAYGIPTVALRFFSVYGPRQALSNPYTGVAAIFASRLMGGAPPMIFEDGRQTRDFIHVRDVASACIKSLALDVGDVALNIGTGVPVTIADVASVLQKLLGGPDAEILETYRHGDIRHCYPDISAARAVLGWEPTISFEQGAEDLVEWVATQSGHAERLDQALDELRRRGLVKDRT
jgi:dTDP-L-rhamnose 4-epimerase